MTSQFSQALLSWFAQQGRHNLPWQQMPTPYRIWISEIMLQQTQVNTVIPYYQRFLEQFPDIFSLANSSLENVLHYWSGLGYYARARHLHQTAQQICSQHQGQIPTDYAQLIQLPGIARSTAGAILALAYQQPYPILDGNVKRILCRYYAIEGWPGQTPITEKLWKLAADLTPLLQVDKYTQAIMDLGATVCTRQHPKCALCPVHSHCAAHQQGQATHYPTPKPVKIRPLKTLFLLMCQTEDGQIFLEKRPLKGIWGGLWSFPECATALEITKWCQHHLNISTPTCYTWPSFLHGLTHFQLDITPIHIPLPNNYSQHNILSNGIWYHSQLQTGGLAAPVSRLLTQLQEKFHHDT